MLPLLLLLTTISISHSRSVYGADIDLQQALNDGCRAAAMQIDPYSQAVGEPYFDFLTAHQTFRNVVSKNLNIQDMTPDGNGPICNLEYYLILPYGDSGHGILIHDENTQLITTGDVIIFNGGNFEYMQDSKLIINSSDGKVIKVKAKYPAIIAIASAELNPILGSTRPVAIRWSAARVISDF